MNIDIKELLLNLRDHTRRPNDKTTDRIDAADVIDSLLELIRKEGGKTYESD